MKRKPRPKYDATGYILGEPTRMQFEHNSETGEHARRQAVEWAEASGVEVLEIAKAPYRNKDRAYFALNPETGKMNRTSLVRAGVINGLVQKLFAESAPKDDEQKRELVHEAILAVVK